MRTGRGIPLGRFFGIAVNLDLSWVIVSLLMAWNLREIVASEVPGRASYAYTILGALSAVLFFSTLLAHELSHALMAKRKGIEVSEITLFLFGGVAKIKSDPTKPGDEFKIAIVGPLASVVIGGVLLGLGIAAEYLHIMLAAVIFQIIGFLNLLLAGFNMLPGFPLDGGRVLRSAIWRVTGDVIKATKISAAAGRLVAAGLIAFGVFRVVRGDLGGLWTVMLGFFLNSAAVGSYRSVLMKRSIDGVTVSQLMNPEPPTIAGNATLDEAIDSFQSLNVDAFAVVGYGGQTEGLVTLQGVKMHPVETWKILTVRQVMLGVNPDIVLGPEEPVSAVIERIQSNPMGRFLVLRGERLVGLVSTADVAQFLRWRADAGRA